MKNVEYYLILDYIVGKREENEEGYKEDYIYRDGKWERDEELMIMDRLMGFDRTESPDSPYRIGNTSVMDEIREISY